MEIKKRHLIGGIIALFVIVLAISLILSGMLQGQTTTQQSLAEKMALDSSDLKTTFWSDDTPWFWNLTGQNSHIDYRIGGQLWFAEIILMVWNSPSEADTAFHSWIDENSTRTNLTIGDESYIENTPGDPQFMHISLIFIRGNVTASVRWDGYVMDVDGLNQAYENVFFYAIAQDSKIVSVQRTLDR